MSLRGGGNDDEGLRIFRSAMILHGRETINGAVERECGDGQEDLVVKMVKRGVWYLGRAGEDLEGVLEEGNVEEVFREDGGIMLSLFEIAGATS